MGGGPFDPPFGRSRVKKTVPEIFEFENIADKTRNDLVTLILAARNLSKMVMLQFMS